MFDHAAHKLAVDEIVGVDKHVAKSDDLAAVIDAHRSLRIMLWEALDCLADNLSVSRDGLALQALGTVVCQALALPRLADEGGGANGLKKLSRLVLQRRFGASCLPIQ